MSRYRFVFSWRWIRLHVLIWLILLPSFYGLGMWQRSRYHERSAENAVIKTAMNASPVPIEGADAVGAAVPKSERWKQLTLVGTFDPAHQFLARNHQNGGNPGFYVITPLTLGDGTSVLVNRGWVPTVSTDEQQSPPIPAAPAGTVTVTGRLQQSETKGNTGIRDVTAGLPTGQISLINTASLAVTTGLRLRGGYTEVISMKPGDSSQITAVDAPSLDEGPYLSYWFQWWLFGVIAIGGWITIIRREAQHRDREAAEAAEEDEYDDEYEEDEEYEEEDDDTEAETGLEPEPETAVASTAVPSAAVTGAASGTATAPAP
ncbi:SURF1 family protein [Catenulispora sp. NF23]|uniref:SURF1-like protein n=1 Tax=Catenulispora pinistramenti TaxID=2705254 RepID=A0ABS5L3R8_9ACTN|nr:SURF1 family protein [Catenulispora pinistramenti]MBS2536637.1 SURF1 family protein [Catenulispora pinistramenti]MBS2552986.1 SURF1 family protein [Catenulispora pinistramenti]